MFKPRLEVDMIVDPLAGFGQDWRFSVDDMASIVVGVGQKQGLLAIRYCFAAASKLDGCALEAVSLQRPTMVV